MPASRKRKRPELVVIPTQVAYAPGSPKVKLNHHLSLPIMGRRSAPHEPTVVLRIAGFQAEQVAGCGGNIDAPLGNGRLENDGLADRNGPESFAGIRGQAKYSAIGGAEK